MPGDILLREDAGAVATLTLNSSKNLNALSDAMLAALQTQLDALGADRSIRAIILRAEGKAFCAGHDLKEMSAGRGAQDAGRAYFADLFKRCAVVMTTLQRLPQPVIAEVSGSATAAGCQLVASCDMALASQGCKFGVNGVDVGLFCSTPMVALTRNVPRKVAFEMLTTGAFISADRAAQIGLINRAVPAVDLATETRALANTVAAKLGAAVKIGKRAFYEQIQMPLDQAYAFTGNVMVENMLYRDTEEGMDAFIEKRDPKWTQ